LSDDKPAENSVESCTRKVGRPFPKGVSGNPGGRPKTKLLTNAYRKTLDQVITQELATELKLSQSFVGKTVTDGVPGAEENPEEDFDS
jgi:Family of unknown function (DUF5681)